MRAMERRGPLERRFKEVRHAWQSGETDSDIAVLFDVTRVAVTLWRKRHAFPRVSRKGRKYATWHHRLQLLMEEGRDAHYIADLLSKRLNTVQVNMFRLKRKEAS